MQFGILYSTLHPLPTSPRLHSSDWSTTAAVLTLALCTVRNTQTFKTEDQHMGDIEMPPESEKQTGSKELEVLLAEAEVRFLGSLG